MTASTKGIALITGASAGIGAIYADRLAKRGYDLILVARNQDRLDALASRLAAETGRSVTPLVADLNDRASLAKVESVLRENAGITMLVNNAGVGSVASILNGDVDAMEDMIKLNITALTRLTYCGGAGLRGARRRHHREHQFGGGDCRGNAERRLQRLEILCAELRPRVAA